MSASSIASFLATLALSKAKQEAQKVNTSGTNLINQFGKTLGAAYLPTGQTVAQTDQAINSRLTDLSGQTKVGASPIFTGQNKNLGDAGLNALGVIAPFESMGSEGGDEAPAPEVDETSPSQLGGLQRMSFPEDEPMAPGMIPPSQRADYSAPASYYKDVPAQPNPPDNGEAVLPPIQPFKNASNLPPIPEQPNTDYAPRSSYVKSTPEEINPHYDATAETGKPGAIRIQPNDELNGPRKAVTAQSAVDNIPGKTATEKFTNAESRVAQLDQQKDALVTQKTNLIPESQLREDYYKQIAPYVAPANTSPTGSQVTPAEAQTMVDNQIAQYQAKNGITPSIDPDTQQLSYTVEQVSQMKDAANLYNKKLLEARGNGVSLTPAQQIELAGRDGLQATLKNAAPDVAKITQEQSGIYDAIPQLSQKAQQEYTTQQNQPTLVQKVGKVLTNPAVEFGLGALGVSQGKNLLNATENTGAKLLGAARNALNAPITAQGIGARQTLPPIKQTSPSDVSSPTPTQPPDFSTHLDDAAIHAKTGVPLTQDEYQTAIQDPRNAPGSTARSVLDQKHTETQQIAAQNMPGNIPLFMKAAPIAYQNVQSLQGTDLAGLSNVFSNLGAVKDFQSYTSDPTKPFATELQKVDQANAFYTQAYTDVTGSAPTANQLMKAGDSPAQLQAEMQAQEAFLGNSFTTYKPFWDAINPSIPDQQSSPTINQSPQQGSSLPPIQAPAPVHMTGGVNPYGQGGGYLPVIR